MALPKQAISIPFGQGLDTKTDPWQVQPGKMLALQNAVFNNNGLLQKRNGFAKLPAIGDSTVNTLATFLGSLTAIGQSLYSLAPTTDTWYNKGPISPVTTEVSAVVRSATSQSEQDAAVTPDGLACVAWADSDGSNYYKVVDTTTGTILVSQVPIGGVRPRVFILGRYFIVTYLAATGSPYAIKFVAIPLTNPGSPIAAATVSSTVSGATGGYDGVVANNFLYLSWNTGAGGGDIQTTYVNSALAVHSAVSTTGFASSFVSLTADNTSAQPTIWVTFFNIADNKIYSKAFSANLVTVLAPTAVATNAGTVKVTSLASSGILTVIYETSHTYSYSSVRTDYISSNTITVGGLVGSPTIIVRSVALASKAFYSGTKQYITAVYGGSFQPTYFLLELNSGSPARVIAKLAYENAGGYPASQVLAGVWPLNSGEVAISYLFKDQLTAVNKSQGVANVAGIYSQTGVNIVKWGINLSPMITSEMANDLHMTGGFPWMYDGVTPVEHGFHLWPEDLKATPSATSGSMIDQQYFYQVTYEWTDAQGNLHRSSPSVPLSALVSGGGGNGSVTLDIPCLRLTYKIQNNPSGNPIRIVIYRWSTAQQNYYQITSITSPLLNVTPGSVDSVSYLDTQADSAILGNQLIYTTGGVVENIAGPACSDFTSYRSRLWLLPSENPNTLWYSKQVLQGTPVEFNDGFTIYVSPTSGAQGSTGPTKCISGMDDKLIMFKRDALYYMTGIGPDSTGAQNDFSDPIFITGTVGSSNPQSIVMTPIGIMFQSDKGIWLLGRDLSTNYIGAPVEAYNSATVLSAVAVPGTNQVRFALDNGIVLMYDYYYNQWGTFNNIPATAYTLYQNLHTSVNSLAQVSQESPGTYMDGSNPVLISFTTAWMSLAGLQGFERAYYFYLLGKYISPHKLTIQIAYDFNPNPSQQVVITPDNFQYRYGDNPGPYGAQSTYGGIADPEQWRIFFKVQKVQSFQITITESYDASFGQMPGAGLTLSGLNLIAGIKKGYKTIKAANSAG